jgi:uncharacterized membrane protein YfhO
MPVTPVLREYTLRTLSFDVNVPEDGWLLVTDRWARSWRARVDGTPAPIWKGNFLFRALQVHAGANAVELTYRPLGYPWLTLLSWLVVGAVLAAPAARGLARHVRGRSSASRAGPPAIPSI